MFLSSVGVLVVGTSLPATLAVAVGPAVFSFLKTSFCLLALLLLLSVTVARAVYITLQGPAMALNRVWVLLWLVPAVGLVVPCQITFKTLGLRAGLVAVD
jgi:hypothetical protein